MVRADKQVLVVTAKVYLIVYKKQGALIQTPNW